jgi:hypothetical protein
MKSRWENIAENPGASDPTRLSSTVRDVQIAEAEEQPTNGRGGFRCVDVEALDELDGTRPGLLAR